MSTELDHLTQTVRSWATHWQRPDIGNTDFIPAMVPLTPELTALLDKVTTAEEAYDTANSAPEDILADARAAEAVYLAAVRTLGIAAADGKPEPRTLPKPVNVAEVETRMRIAMTASDAAGGRLRKAQNALNDAIKADRPRWREPILAWIAETAAERAEAQRRANELAELAAMANEGLRLANDAAGIEQPWRPNHFVSGVPMASGLIGK